MKFEEYVALRGPDLLRLGYLLTGRQHAAEDLVQVALTKAMRHWRRVEVADHPDAYMRRIMTNAFIDANRSASRRETPTDDLSTEWPEATIAADPAEIIASDLAFWALVQDVSPRARAILVLRYYLDVGDHEISRMLEIKESTVRATAARALSDLRQRITVDAGSAARSEGSR